MDASAKLAENYQLNWQWLIFFFALHNYTNAIKSMVLSVFISLTYTDIANVSLITYKDKTFQSLIKPKLSVLCENITASRKALKQVK